MKHALITLVFVIGIFSSFAQQLYNPDTILVGASETPEVLLVGSYHFAYYNLDAHKTDEDKQIDVLSKERQQEIEELVRYIAEFKPTKIVVEYDSNTSELMHSYREYLNGKYALGRDEQEQIGFRLMKKFNLDTIYGVDAHSIAEEMFNSRDSSISLFAQSLFSEYDFQSNDTLSARYTYLYQMEDSLKLKSTMLEYFKHMNSDKMLTSGYGAYLVGDYKLSDNRGADALSMFWYDRNLRIFRNIQQIPKSKNDRIVVIFGSGHVQILKQLFESSPEYQLVKFNEL